MGKLIFQADSEKLTKLGTEIRSNDEDLINYVKKVEEILVDLGHSWKDQSYYVYLYSYHTFSENFFAM